MPLAQLSAGVQSLPLLPTNKLGPDGAVSRVGGFVYILFVYLWVSPMNSPVRLGVSSATATPTDFFQPEVLRL